VGLAGELAEERACVIGRLDLFEQIVLGKLLGREVAEVLVEPVGDVSTGDLLVPPRMVRASSTQDSEMFQSSLTS